LSTLPLDSIDATVLAARSELDYLRGDLTHAAELGLEVLRMESAGPRAKVKVLLPLGFAAASEGRIPEAARHFGELARLRRNPDDWYFLGKYEHELGHDAAAIRALTTALRLELSSVAARELLAQIYHSRQDFDAEQRLRDEIEKLSRKSGIIHRP
jgi:tetratricopeptide (TPR) repeat protein